jgi:hypothetical protein
MGIKDTLDPFNISLSPFLKDNPLKVIPDGEKDTHLTLKLHPGGKLITFFNKRGRKAWGRQSLRRINKKISDINKNLNLLFLRALRI